MRTNKHAYSEFLSNRSFFDMAFFCFVLAITTKFVVANRKKKFDFLRNIAPSQYRMCLMEFPIL